MGRPVAEVESFRITRKRSWGKGLLLSLGSSSRLSRLNASATLAASAQQTEQAMAVMAKAIEDTRQEDNRAIYAALQKVESQSFAQFVSLKKDVDTVALNTDAGLRDTAQELVQLADYKQPAGIK